MATGITAMASRSVRRTAATAVLLLATTVAGCRQAERESLPAGYAYAPMQWPVAWRREGNSLVLFHLERGVNRSGGLTLCTGSGVYQSPAESGSPSLLFPLSPEVCRLDLRPETTGGAVGSMALVVAEGDSLKVIDLQEGRVSGVAAPGLSLRRYGALSPDGGSVAFVAVPVGGNAGATQGDCLYTMDVNGSGIHRVSCFEAQRVRSSPSWSPDMTRVVLSTSEPAGGPFYSRGSVVTIETATGHWRELASGYFPSWSPDGTRIAYLSVPVVDTTLQAHSDSSLGSALRVINEAGSEDQLVLASPGSHVAAGGWILDGWAWAPIVWSPDGNWLAFSRLEGHGSRIWEVSVSDRSLRQGPQPERTSGSRRN
jgi:hypothetical protein